MATLRSKDARAMGKEELREKIDEFRKELSIQNAKISSGGLPDNPGKIKEMKKAIARIYTLSGEKGYQLHE